MPFDNPQNSPWTFQQVEDARVAAEAAVDGTIDEIHPPKHPEPIPNNSKVGGNTPTPDGKQRTPDGQIVFEQGNE